jgi:putative SOS response-associated peptidase YedK
MCTGGALAAAEVDAATAGRLFGLLTCEPNAEIDRAHPKAMPAIITTAREHDDWMRAMSLSET